MNHEPTEGVRVECRWNKGCVDGYGLYRADGGWTFHEDFALRERADQQASPEAVAERQAFLSDFRGRRLRDAMKD